MVYKIKLKEVKMKKTICKYCGDKITCRNKQNIQEYLNEHYKFCKKKRELEV